MPMFSEQRKTEILNLLNERGSVSVGELMETFSVSEATVRRDLTELESMGRLRRTHGGAVPRNMSLYESSYAESKLVNVESKMSIARACERLVRDNHTVLLDSGTTTFEIAKQLRHKNITLVTNSVTVVRSSWKTVWAISTLCLPVGRFDPASVPLLALLRKNVSDGLFRTLHLSVQTDSAWNGVHPPQMCQRPV